MTFGEAVQRAARAVPRGSVVSYSQLAARAGFPGAARAAGTVLAATTGLPWWRVVRSDGRLASSDPARQAALLAAEGVTVESGRVASRHLLKTLSTRPLD